MTSGREQAAQGDEAVQDEMDGELPLDDVAGVHAGHVGAAGHIGQRVLHRLSGNEWPAKCFAVTTPLDGQVQAALRTGICLRGKTDTLGDECRGDLEETRVFRTHQIGDRYPHIGVGQLGGIA